MDLCFVGGGNMASALIGGLIEGDTPIRSIHVIEPLDAAREVLEEKFSAKAKKHNLRFIVYHADAPESLVETAESVWVVLAVKPQQMRKACEQAPTNLRSLLSRASILSIAAGISIEAITAWCNTSQVVRAMPNTPALIRQGITGLYAPASISEKQRLEVNEIMQSVGQTLWMDDETLLDAVTALSGSGPAYVFLFVEALGRAGVRLGLNPDHALTLTLKTLEGALALMRTSHATPAELRGQVTSKGGTTAAALASLQRAEFSEIVERALKAARDRGAEISREHYSGRPDLDP